MTDDRKIPTNSFKRDQDTNALLAVDGKALQKHNRSKKQNEQLQYQSNKIESLERQVQDLQQQINRFLENNNAN